MKARKQEKIILSKLNKFLILYRIVYFRTNIVKSFILSTDYIKQMQAFTVIGILITFFCMVYFVMWLKGSCPLFLLTVFVEIVGKCCMR